MLLQNRDPVQFFPSIVDLKTHSHQDDNYKNFKYKVPLDRKKHHRWVLLGVAKFAVTLFSLVEQKHIKVTVSIVSKM